jgi:glycosyltransferase involved in cell wall biosynthesis
VAGRGDDPRSLDALMGDPARYDIRHRFIEDREVAQLFLDADLVVLPYREASQSGVIPVAATFGKPVVVTDVGELRATVTRQGLGLVVPAGDPQSLADAIATMASNADLRRQCGDSALDWSDLATGPNFVGARTVEIYDDILQRT